MRLIVFDCDGTLVDSQGAIVATMTATFTELGLPSPRPDAIRALIGLSLEETAHHLWPQGDDAGCARLVEIYRRRFFEQRSRAPTPDPLFPYAHATLATLEEAGYLLGVATGKSSRGLDAVLRSHNLQDVFLTRQTADGHPGKPHPGMLLQAMAEAGVTADNTLMLGDTSFDMAMALNAGVTAVGVAWGYHGVAELRDAGARAVLEDFRDLPPFLNGHWPLP
ncbi:MAG: HAD-IA family hydrolase [Alphaproteobacteria bacterium]|nr:HAD-IA family hydrolase [Alphaproteobacteria bacterium]